MSDDSKSTGNGKNEKKSEIKVPSRNWLLWILILGCIPLLMVFKDRKDAKFDALSRQQLIELVSSNLVQNGVIHYNPQSSVLNEITGTYAKADPQTGAEIQVPFRVKTKLTEDLESSLLNKGFEVQEPNTFLLNIFVTILPILFVAFLITSFSSARSKWRAKAR